MCQVGSSDQLYQNKNQQVKQNIVVNQQQNLQQQQKVVQPVYEEQEEEKEEEKYTSLKVDTSYSDFMERFHPLSGTAVEGNQPPPEEKLGWKERKRRNKIRKELYQLKVDDAKVIPRLVFAEDLKKMEMFSSWDKKDREHWEKQVIPHSKLTRGETL